MGSTPQSESFDARLARARLHLERFKRLVEARDFAALESVYTELEEVVVVVTMNCGSAIPSSEQLDALEALNDELATLERELRALGRDPSGMMH